jgi:hypothetical protein
MEWARRQGTRLFGRRRTRRPTAAAVAASVCQVIILNMFCNTCVSLSEGKVAWRGTWRNIAAEGSGLV